jgi:phenylacetaldehyde dehydrogenase
MNEATTAIKLDNRVLLPSVMEFMRSSPRKLLIGGKWVAARSGKVFETINPATEEVLALAAEGDKPDVDEAVRAAR